MSEMHSCFFAVPTAHTGELIRLSAAALAGLYGHTADANVLNNRATRHAEEVATYKIVVQGDHESSAFAGLTGVIRKAGKAERNQDVFTPAELPKLTQGLAKLKASLGEDRLVRRIINKSLETSPEAVRRVLAAFEETLAVAAATPDTGFFWSYFYPNAEAEYAEHLAREEALRNAPPPPPLTAEERAEQEARLDEDMEILRRRTEEGYRWLIMADEAGEDHGWGEALLVMAEPAATELVTTGELAGLPAWDLDAVKTGRVTGGTNERRLAKLRERITELAEEATELRLYGEYTVMGHVRTMLCEGYPGAYQATGIYAPEQAQALYQAALALERSEGGQPGLIDRLRKLARVPRKSYASGPWRALKRAARTAGQGGRTLLWLRDP